MLATINHDVDVHATVRQNANEMEWSKLLPCDPSVLDGTRAVLGTCAFGRTGEEGW
jgi:hypothetical protein